MSIKKLKNIAIIAHVDHGKTTLMDVLFKQTHTLSRKNIEQERIMDNNPLEKERGITIQAKNASLTYKDYKINLIDTPGHADFGGEVERILNMVDGVLLLVDAFEGPMPQTRFVTRKALGLGIKAIVVVNKVDRTEANPETSVDKVFDLFVECDANDEQQDFPIIYASAKEGWAVNQLGDKAKDITPLLDCIIKNIPSPQVDLDKAFQMIISDIQYDNYIGSLAVGRIKRGKIKSGEDLKRISICGKMADNKVNALFGFSGMEREEVSEANAGDIVLIAGIENPKIGETLCHPSLLEALPVIKVDPPTLSMFFQVNDGPFSGKEGKFVTSRQLRERLYQEALTNISMKVEDTDRMEIFKVSGRGELHLSILIENMRREGYEFCVSRPKVIILQRDQQNLEPVEDLHLEVPDDSNGAVIEELGQRKAEIKDIAVINGNRRLLKAIIPTRGLLAFRSLLLTLTKGEGIMYHSFKEYQPYKGATITRKNGVLIAHQTGEAVPYSIFNLQERGVFIIPPGVSVYQGMIVGIHSKENDLNVNVCATKKLTNIRASGKDDSVRIIPHKEMLLEQALEFIKDDELVEVTPRNIRVRKLYLSEIERKRHRPPKLS